MVVSVFPFVKLLFLFINSLIFLGLGALHLYWANGGEKFANSVLPELPDNGKPVFTPTPTITALVGFGLLMVSFIGWYCVFAVPIHKMGIINWYSLVLGIVFGIRAIGDFKYVGLTKKVKGTTFAENDTLYYTPLCIYLAITNLGIFF